MNFQRYFLAIFAAAALSASPIAAMTEGASDNHNRSSAEELYGEPQGEERMTEEQRQEWESDGLAQLEEKLGEPLPSSYCFTESIIDESTGEILALQHICEDMADVA